MALKPDAVVANADELHIPGRVIMIQFDKMRANTFKPIGKKHIIAMTPADAIRLLGVLQAMAEHYKWPNPPNPDLAYLPSEKGKE